MTGALLGKQFNLTSSWFRGLGVEVTRPTIPSSTVEGVAEDQEPDASGDGAGNGFVRMITQIVKAQ
jgi:hypothetical protein